MASARYQVTSCKFETMKKLELSCKEFLHFRAVCEKFRILFNLTVTRESVYIVEAKEELLESIGY